MDWKKMMKRENKIEKMKKVKMMKSSDLRVYKDNCRPAVFDDKRRKVKHKKKIMEQYG